MKILSFLAAIAVALLATAGAATADESDVGSTGSLSLSLVDGSGALVAGSCFELYTASGGSYGELVNTFCNTTGSSAWTLPEGPYVLREVQPPHLRLVRDAPAESHVYRKAPDTTFGISALHPDERHDRARARSGDRGTRDPARRAGRRRLLLRGAWLRRLR